MTGPAGARDISTVDGWELSTTGKTCTMVSTFADDVMIGLILSPKTGELGFMAAGHELEGAADKEDGRGRPHVRRRRPITQWEDQRAVVDLSAPGKRRGGRQLGARACRRSGQGGQRPAT